MWLLRNISPDQGRFYGGKPDANPNSEIEAPLTDVETEVNGLITYDRQVLRVDPGVFNTD